MRTPLDIAFAALNQILDIEKSANSGWNGLANAASIARRALQDMERLEGMAVDRACETDREARSHPCS